MKPNSLYILPAFAFLMYLAAALYVLSYGHLHEDAYILYVFSESLAAGNGIAYFPGGLPAEGATDFLWMVLLGFGDFVGIDVAISAALLNGAGIAVITWVAVSLLGQVMDARRTFIVGAVFTFVIFLSQIAQASLAGFSTGFYSSLSALIFYLIYRSDPHRLYLIPVVGIVMGLVRPDGVIIGASASIIGLFLAIRLNSYKRYLVSSLACLVVGIIYFSWRYNYFGMLLPLPLYVKGGAAGELPGLPVNVFWLKSNLFLAALALAVLFTSGAKRVVLASVPFVLLLLALSFATQSQNIDYRFQAPVTVLLILSAVVMMSGLYDLKDKSSWLRKGYVFPALVAAVLILPANARSMVLSVERLMNKEYINYFPFHLAQMIDGATSVALTEAGRFAYWLPGKKYDLVGLNTPEVAVDGVSPTYIASISPDLLFFHVARTADLSSVCKDDYCEITEEQLLGGVLDDAAWGDVSYGVRRAPLAIYRHIQEHPSSYRVFVVKYYGRYDHVYLLRRDGRIDVDGFKEALSLSFSESGALSYFEIKQSGSFRPVF